MEQPLAGFVLYRRSTDDVDRFCINNILDIQLCFVTINCEELCLWKMVAILAYREMGQIRRCLQNCAQVIVFCVISILNLKKYLFLAHSSLLCLVLYVLDYVDQSWTDGTISVHRINVLVECRCLLVTRRLVHLWKKINFCVIQSNRCIKKLYNFILFFIVNHDPMCETEITKP